MTHRNLPLISLLALCGCVSLFRGAITLTEVVDSGARQYAVLYKQGLVSDETHAKVTKAHDQYRASAKNAADALKAYKLSGNEADYVRALAVTRVAAIAFVDRIVPLLVDSKGTKLKADLQNAHTL